MAKGAYADFKSHTAAPRFVYLDKCSKFPSGHCAACTPGSVCRALWFGVGACEKAWDKGVVALQRKRMASTTHRLVALLGNPVVRVVQATAILHCINEYAVSITACAGPSMIPTFNQSGDVIFAEMLSPKIGRLKRGDVVIAVPPQNPKLRVCKRIIGLPGETVLVRSRSWYHDRPEYIPEGHVWLEGDNPSNSSDSRSYGPIPLAMVRGRVFVKAWPPSEIGRVVRRVPEAASAVLDADPVTLVG